MQDGNMEWMNRQQIIIIGKKKLELGSAPKPQGYLGHNQDNSIVTDHNRMLNL